MHGASRLLIFGMARFTKRYSVLPDTFHQLLANVFFLLPGSPKISEKCQLADRYLVYTWTVCMLV